MLYQVQLAWSGIELTTLVVIGTDYIGSYNSNNHMITTTTPPPLDVYKIIEHYPSWYGSGIYNNMW
jgi:hypothetical protein